MSFKSAIQPLCRRCGAKIPKYTTTTYFGRRMNGIDKFPHSKEEAQRLVNGKVVSVRWDRVADHNFARSADEPNYDYIQWVGVWDGETYTDEFFCRQPCAVHFAYAMARNGYYTKRYADARDAA